ncbi:hypothetical protein WJX74_007227 [Apatococcus lobatus]|uniref:Mitochondrial processing peptidase n=1 Tax=Apatococcus lobatus TaxID=904363 RepID=A0AAW1RC58_9CHLO
MNPCLAQVLPGLFHISPLSRRPEQHRRTGLNCAAIAQTEAAKLSRRDALGLLSVTPLWLASRDAAATPMAGGSTQNFAGTLEQRVQEVTLPNGLQFLVLQRTNAPIVSCHTHANVGAFDEVTGQTGMAHLLEHMAFKGTARVGTRDYAAEAPLLEALDEAFYELRETEAGGTAAGSSPAAQRFARLIRQAGDLSVSNGYGALLSRAGAVGLNASTSHDATKFYISLPSNKLELWFALEAERFQAPVFRELYTEKQVVAEERRSRVENAPLGRYQEAFARACLTNNYGRPVIGYSEDVAKVGRRELQTFFEQHYGPRALTIAIVGDVTIEQVDRLAHKYFADWQQPTTLVQAAPSPLEEPLPCPSSGPMRFDGASPAGPALLQAFYRPNMQAKESTVVDVISDVLSGSRLSRLYSNLVQQDKAYSAVAIPGWPGEKHASALLMSAVPAASVSLEQLEKLIHQELQDLAASGPSPAELQRIKKAAKFALVDAVSSNSSMASALATYQVLTGSWRNILQDLSIIEGLSAEDIRSVSAEMFNPNNCFTGYVQPLKA